MAILTLCRHVYRAHRVYVPEPPALREWCRLPPFSSLLLNLESLLTESCCPLFLPTSSLAFSCDGFCATQPHGTPSVRVNHAPKVDDFAHQPFNISKKKNLIRLSLLENCVASSHRLHRTEARAKVPRMLKTAWFFIKDGSCR